MTSSTNTSGFSGFKNSIQTPDDLSSAKEHIASVLNEEFAIKLRNARLTNVVAKICGYASTQALVAKLHDDNERSVERGQGVFPFQESRVNGDDGGVYFATFEDALIMVETLGLPQKEKHIWCVAAMPYGLFYSPNLRSTQQRLGNIGFIVTREAHDGDTCYREVHDGDTCYHEVFNEDSEHQSNPNRGTLAFQRFFTSRTDKHGELKVGVIYVPIDKIDELDDSDDNIFEKYYHITMEEMKSTRAFEGVDEDAYPYTEEGVLKQLEDVCIIAEIELGYKTEFQKKMMVLK